MTRRKLRLPSSSDEDDALPRPQTEATSNPNPCARPENANLQISDDEFMEAQDTLPDRLSPTLPPDATRVNSEGVKGSANDAVDVSDRLVDEFLRGVGLGLRREWLASCLTTLSGSVPGFEELDVAGKARLCFEQFLLADMNFCGAGILPDNVHCMNKVELDGPFVLQVDEITNISCSLRGRYYDSPVGLKRCLKLSLTDGVQHVFCMEYRPVHDLEVLSQAGMKVIIRNVPIRRGLLLLLPEAVEVLGGLAEDLDAARHRFISEVNKPPRGKRKQALIPLSQRAALVSWPSTNVNGETANTLVPASDISISQPNALESPSLSNPKPMAQGTIPDEPNGGDHVHPNTGKVNLDDVVSQDSGRNLCEGFIHVKENRVIHNSEGSSKIKRNINADAADDVQDIHAMDVDGAVNESNYPMVLTGEKEIPFTYLACLFAKWNLSCILTGIKRFQFKHRSTYELLVYVDDGSYISEVIIDHSVVQNKIGYSPEDVAAALSSSDKKTKADMTEMMKKYEFFLSTFEGTILVELNKESPFPVALEMSQGCTASDAWLLLRRLKSFAFEKLQHGLIEPINLSP
ncbi:hypothetical protein HPP92_021694 [Vanilla planifolia]|uniref:RecQ-mediated genome instability protein 1 n=1 Tax=Vanilla planifolia TaxID=51239 RepID=A0A835Q4S8_VANPL|nr:hypothetical protein HPP92_021694 [Vanilla planifolia]